MSSLTGVKWLVNVFYGGSYLLSLLESFRKTFSSMRSPPVFPKNNFRVLAQIRVKSRTSVFLIADSVQSLELIPAVIEQNSGYTLVMSPVRRPIHPHTPIQTWVKGFKLTNSSKEKEEAFICCSAC